MPVTITWSTTQNGTAVAESLTGGSNGVDHGSGTNGTTLSQREIWVRHDGTNAITGCGLYIANYSNTYGGGASASVDLTEIIGWGDSSTANAFGGFQVNMNSGDTNPGDWPTVSAKQPTNGSAFFTGVGDNADNKVLLSTTMGAAVTSTGVIAASNTDAQLYFRIQIPTDEDTTGIRQMDQKLAYTFTS